MTSPFYRTLLLTGALLASVTVQAQLESGFQSPPNSSKPRTWMHAMSGNMSKAGMTKDLESLAAAGEGGVILFNIANTIPYGTVAYNSDEHHEIITHAAKECERLDLSFGVHNCDGWSSSGGPWITPEQSMKMVVASETVVDGGGQVDIALPQPTTREGLYQDIAVIAYPALESEILDARLKPTVTASDKDFDIETATDGLNAEEVELRKGSSKTPWILFDYGEPYPASSLDIFCHAHRPEISLEISDDGENFTEARKLKKPNNIGKQKLAFSEQFEPITARYFRFSFNRTFAIREIQLSATRLYDNYIGLSGLGKADKYLDAIETPDPAMVIPQDDLINLTSSFTSDGQLKGELPEGKWTVLRFGYTSTGAINWPASKWGVGLECDKYDRRAFKKHFDSFAKRVIDDAKPVAPNALQYIEVDSYEMGGQTWTEGFAETFEKDKGYDLIPFLPLFVGKYIDSPELISNVTWDLKKIYGTLMTENYFDYFSELCHENGLVSYVEPYGNGPVNGLDICAKVDIPMGEFWTTQPTSIIDTPISGAHIYGKPVISAEAFTSRTTENWMFHPAMGKSKGDEMWAKGINEFMFHRFTHQANTHVKPGLTMARYGSHVDGTQTWWMNAGKAWFSYLTRGQHLLRQGHHAADVLVFTGDSPNNAATFKDRRNCPIPYGTNFDSTNFDVLANRITLQDEKMVLPEGNPYSLLMLENINIIEFPTLKRIQEIAEAGVSIVGKKPKKLGGYGITYREQEEFEALVSEIWNHPNCNEDFDFSSLEPDFQIVGEPKKIFMHRRTETEDIYFFSNPDMEAKIYECSFRVAGKIPEFWDPVTGEITKLARFESDGKRTRVWVKLESLQSAFIIFRESSEGVPSIVKADDSSNFFLNNKNEIICESHTAGEQTVTLSDGSELSFTTGSPSQSQSLSTAWQVEFLEEHDYAKTLTFDTLSDWKDHADEKIKYYSGTAIYRKRFTLDAELKDSQKAILDLGDVSIAAEVKLNGQDVGVLWIAPFATDISEYLVTGENEIEIRITNQWTNRLIGDERFPKQNGGYQLSTYTPKEDSSMPDWYLNNEPMPEGPRTTFCSGQFYSKNDPLLPSGLMGPVKIQYQNVFHVQN